MAKHNKLGEEGEFMAAAYLTSKGYVILEQNWLRKRKEIDIIAMDGETLVMVEVKTRSTENFGEPEEFVGMQKQKNLIEAANMYIDETAIDAETRFDVLSIVKESKDVSVRHIKDAFYPVI